MEMEMVRQCLPSDSRLDSGTEPVSSTVRMPSVMSAMPSVREKYTSRATHGC